jgi:hypothetical protein
MSNLRRRLAVLAGLVLACSPAGKAAAQTLSLSVDTLAFAGRVGGPNPPPQTIAITNTGSGKLTWQVVPTTIAPWPQVGPPTGGAPQNLSFSVRLAGLVPGVYTDTVEIASNDADSPAMVVVVLTVQPTNAPGGKPGPGPQPSLPPIPSSGRYLAEYQVEFVFTGYTGLVEGYPNCQVNVRGTDRATNMRANLTVDGEADRGALLKAVVDTGVTTKAVQGTCDPQETSDALNEFPGASDGGGGSPDGQPIEDVLSPTKFFIGGLARLRVGTYLPRPKLAAWALHVIRKIR